ncbi:hypothetical protein N7540_008436 [Penicillium herquei]|nr:hypothetical protein N7540_008436 [Penicillium herquei]
MSTPTMSSVLYSEHKKAAISVICKGKCFYVQLSPENFSETPELLEKYTKLMEDVCDDDFDVSEKAEHEDKLFPKWLSFYPKDIEIERLSVDEALSRFPRKVSANGNFYHFKPIYTGNQLAALREIGIYRRLEEIFSEGEIRVPFLHGVVRDKDSPVVIGFLLTWIECGTENLECILSSESETPLHEAGIVWGDAKAANILIDSSSNDAWIIDFGGVFTCGWAGESQTVTIEGDLAALAKKEGLLHPERNPKKRGLEESDEIYEMKKSCVEDTSEF